MKIFLVASDIFSIYNYRFPLIKRLRSLGQDVVVIAPFLNFNEYVDRLKQHQVRCINIKMDIWGTNPIQDIFLLYQLFRIYRSERPQIVQHFTIKPVIYGTLAARMAGVKNIFNMITGRGSVFTGDSLKKRLLRHLVKILYRISLQGSSNTFFLNRSDQDFFISNRLLNIRKTTLLPGEGVDIEFFKSRSLEIKNQKKIIFLFIGRMMWEKGVGEFVQAARRLKQKYPKTRFLLLGMIEHGNPLSIPANQIDKWQKEGIVEYLGMKNDVRPFIERADVVVLPSYYFEGIPRSLLEAASMSRPIITTNTPGCREVVKDGVNGFLVPIKDVKALTEAMERFILNPHLKISMGREGRKLAVKKFDVRKVNKIILSHWGLL